MRKPRGQVTTRGIMGVVAISAVLLAAFEAGRRVGVSSRAIGSPPIMVPIRSFDITCVSTPVDGIIVDVDPKKGRVKLSIGSDDGLKIGDVLFVYRGDPSPMYVGKIRILTLNYDEATGEPVGMLKENNLEMKEYDRVSSKFP